MKRTVVAVLAMFTMLAATLAPAGAQDAPTGPSSVSVLHGIPGLTVDVYAGGNLLLDSFEPKDIAGPLELAAGDYLIEVFAEAPTPAATTAGRTDGAAITQTVAVPAGLNVSLVAHLDGAGTPRLTAFVNDLSAVSSVTEARLTVRHTAAAPTVDIVAGGAAVDPFTGLSNGGEATAELPAADYPTGIAATGTTDVLFPAPVSLKPGAGVIVYAIGTLANGTFDLMVQSFTGLGLEPEFRGTDGIDGTIARLYLAMLGRSPDTAGFAYWKAQEAAGLGILGIISNFEVSTEFQTRFPEATTDAAWLDLAYAHVLGRTPDAPGKAYWMGLLDSGALDRHEMLLYFAESAEFKAYTGTN